MHTKLFALLLAILAFAISTNVSQGESKPPNVVIIIADDQGWGDYSFMGHPQIRTPNIDRLAAESLTFRRGYVPSSLCRASLVSIITGLYPHQHKITSNDPPLPPGGSKNVEADATFLAQREEMISHIDKIPTLPRRLTEKGYVSFQTGKWWEGNFKRGGFTDGMTQGQRHGDAGLKIGRDTMQPIYDFIDKATSDQKPFFVWYAPFLPHTPHNPPERLLEKYRDKAPTPTIAKYWAMCEWLDETCGQLRSFLDKKKLTDDTLLIFLADNGWIQDPHENRYASRSKQSQYDGGLRTPILVHWPAHLQARVSDRIVSSLDLAPTILAAAGLTPTPEMPGLNLLDESAVAARKAIHGEIFTHNAVDIQKPASSLRFRWIIADDWKLIVPNAQNEPKANAELFHILKDPQEQHNVAAEQLERVAEMTKRLDAWWSVK